MRSRVSINRAPNLAEAMLDTKQETLNNREASTVKGHLANIIRSSTMDGKKDIINIYKCFIEQQGFVMQWVDFNSKSLPPHLGWMASYSRYMCAVYAYWHLDLKHPWCCRILALGVIDRSIATDKYQNPWGYHREWAGWLRRLLLWCA
jgi:hypothetical protein